jgi:hypothetical protein
MAQARRAPAGHRIEEEKDEKDRVIGNRSFNSCNNSYGRDAARNVAPS